ncbi:hypothetical protein JCGZ_26568 [Jatropha curcas]|uniref:Aminotransferase-like plant mobile domain-containing protein n=1 Tax=Jatropha curcas TaxID=180498 RepID=A0A067JKZ5_JATCU|nr:hypothetical protein JCGZ_26568 [Jatropha curcas]
MSEGFEPVGSFDWATLALAHLYHGLDVWRPCVSRESNWLFIRPLEYRIYPGGPSGDSPAESRRIPRYLAHCHHTYASGEDPEYWRSFLNDRELSDGLTREDLEVEYRGFSANDFLSVGDFPAYFSSRMQARLPEILEYTQERKTHKTTAHYKAEAAAEAGAAVAPAGPAGGVLGDVSFPPGMEVVLDPGADPEVLGAVSAVRVCPILHWSSLLRAAEVDRLRTRLEVEGIPLDSSDEDDDGSSDDAPSSPAPQAAAGPSRRRR